MERTTRTSVSTLMAWFSACLLAAGIGAEFGSSGVKSLWMQAGCFGLVAAVGLESANRLRTQRRMHDYRSLLRTRWDKECERILTEQTVCQAKRKALGHMVSLEGLTAKESDVRRIEPRVNTDLKVAILTLPPAAVQGAATDLVSRPARLRNISMNGFSISLDDHLLPQRSILSVTLEDGKMVDLVGEILWCHRAEEGDYTAGGRLIRVLSEHAIEA